MLCEPAQLAQSSVANYILEAMATASTIEWTQMTWNPVRGCTRVSPGCEHCYAERMAHRFAGPGGPYEGLTKSSRKGPKWTGRLRTLPEVLPQPLSWRAPKMVFVNSMSDLFHERVPDDFIRDVFGVMARAHWHQFQLLTKRSARLRALAPQLQWPQNVWMCVSVEDQRYVARIDNLRHVPATVRFLSLEPLLGPLPTLDLAGVHWAIVGGESGPGARPIDAAWVRQIRDQCLEQHVPFFFKQWGGVRKKANGRMLDGRTWDQIPSRGGENLPCDNAAGAAINTPNEDTRSATPGSWEGAKRGRGDRSRSAGTHRGRQS